MFTVILPKDRLRHKLLLERMFLKREGFKQEPGKDSFDTRETLYIVYENPTIGMYGSVRVNPLRHSLVCKRGLLSKSFSPNKTFMEVSFVSFDVVGDLNESPNFDFHTHRFYKGLYEALRTLAISQDYAGYLSVNWPDEHDDCAFFGQWPFQKLFDVDVPNLDFPLSGAILTCVPALSTTSH